ncbi:MAG: carbonate dehydratase [Deltaproteobacteria bacterium CG11_big_fil_rev_8_21_14_0_20_47_16]|nr:MAG: carbonate dehydratase [Deltaproteobacteria bacterium CG11_big_fil_rev_8_21_14_0_20_47_16]
MKSYEELLLENRAWVKQHLYFDPNFFKRHAEGQEPRFLWIGCSDSRVPAEHLTGSGYGELFVHRNIANQAHLDDNNVLSVLAYAVDVLKVHHIIVCGHEHCGGVIAAQTDTATGIVKEWLKPIYEIKGKQASQLATMSQVEQQNTLVRWNIEAQVDNLKQCPIIQKAWERGQGLAIHGWLYELETGLLKSLCYHDHI